MRLGVSYRNYPGVGIQSEVAEVRHTQAFALREILGAGPFGNSLALYPGGKKLRHVGLRLHILPSQHDNVGLAASALWDGLAEFGRPYSSGCVLGGYAVYFSADLRGALSDRGDLRLG